MQDFYENKYYKSFCFIARETGGEEHAGALPLCPSQISQAKLDRVLTFFLISNERDVSRVTKAKQSIRFIFGPWGYIILFWRHEVWLQRETVKHDYLWQ